MIEYTLAQFKEYSRAVARQSKQQLRDHLWVVRAAQYDKENFKKVDKALRDG